MASQTPIHQLPYPDPEDATDFAGDIQKLATAIDGMASTNGITSAAQDPIGVYFTNFLPTYPLRPYAWHQAGPLVSFEIFVQRTGSSLTGSATGDLTNVQIGTLRTEIPRPVHPALAVNPSSGPLAGLYILPDGTLWIGNIAPNTSWNSGVRFTTSFFYMAAV